jgi:hypothetical protein
MKVSKEIIPPFSFLRQNPVKGYGEFNGYVSLPIGHPWYGKTYPKLQMVDVHYGLTYSEEEDGRWVIGFDTAHAGDEHRDWDREKVRKEANKLLDQAESAERRKREQEKERRIELECHEKREEGRHWYQPYPEAVPLDLWELFRALTYELYGKINHELLMKTVTHHSKRSDKLDAYRIYPERGDGILTAGSSFKLIVGIRYGMSVDDYDSPFVTNETAALFNLDPLNRDN